MKLGYKEEDYQICIDHIEDGVYLKDNILYIYIINYTSMFGLNHEYIDFIDIRKIIHELTVETSLEGIFIYGNAEELVNIGVLKSFTNLKIINIRNVEVKNLEWLTNLTQIESFTLSSTLGYEKGAMQDSFYHPLKYLSKLKYLDISFSRFSEKAVYLSDNVSIFDTMDMLEYINLRETNFSGTSFLSFLNKRNIVLNFIDNIVKLDYSKYNNICLITIITAYKDGSLVDISGFIGH